jgi:hypothetical protein
VAKDKNVASLLGQLQDSDSVLLMYLADELPVEDRLEVERMLAVDAGMRAQFERLRETHAWFADTMARADLANRPAVPEAAAVRRVGRAMRQWNARRLAAAPAPAARRTLRYPWWAYPLAAAASVVIAFLVWWGNTDRPSLARKDTLRYEDVSGMTVPSEVAVASNDRADLLASSFDDYLPDAAPAGPGGDWDDSRALYAAVAPSDANVLMFLNNNGTPGGPNGAAPDDLEAAPDNDPTTLQ